MKKITLTFEETKEGLVGMSIKVDRKKETDKEDIVSNQMLEYIMNAKLDSYMIGKGEGNTLEEAIAQADIEKDIFMAGKRK